MFEKLSAANKNSYSNFNFLTFTIITVLAIITFTDIFFKIPLMYIYVCVYGDLDSCHCNYLYGYQNYYYYY